MDTDLTPIDESEDEELEALFEPAPPATEQDGRAVTIMAERLSKHFTYKGGIIKAVDEVSFTFTEYQFVTIMGPSGSGKTTLLYVMGGLGEPTSGKLFVDGVDVSHLSEQQEHLFRRQKLGFVFQSFQLLPNLTALENVMLPMQLAGGKSQEQMRERARMLLFQVGINEDRHGHKPGRLSGGQQQRVAIARALANDPKVILADEPTGNLETHDRSIAKEADVRLELSDGRIISTGSYVAPIRTTTLIRKKKGKRQ